MISQIGGSASLVSEIIKFVRLFLLDRFSSLTDWSLFVFRIDPCSDYDPSLQSTFDSCISMLPSVFLSLASEKEVCGSIVECFSSISSSAVRADFKFSSGLHI